MVDHAGPVAEQVVGVGLPVGGAGAVADGGRGDGRSGGGLRGGGIAGADVADGGAAGAGDSLGVRPCLGEALEGVVGEALGVLGGGAVLQVVDGGDVAGLVVAVVDVVGGGVGCLQAGGGGVQAAGGVVVGGGGGEFLAAPAVGRLDRAAVGVLGGAVQVGGDVAARDPAAEPGHLADRVVGVADGLGRQPSVGVVLDGVEQTDVGAVAGGDSECRGAGPAGRGRAGGLGEAVGGRDRDRCRLGLVGGVVAGDRLGVLRGVVGAGVAGARSRQALVEGVVHVGGLQARGGRAGGPGSRVLLDQPVVPVVVVREGLAARVGGLLQVALGVVRPVRGRTGVRIGGGSFLAEHVVAVGPGVPGAVLDRGDLAGGLVGVAGGRVGLGGAVAGVAAPGRAAGAVVDGHVGVVLDLQDGAGARGQAAGPQLGADRGLDGEVAVRSELGPGPGVSGGAGRPQLLARGECGQDQVPVGLHGQAHRVGGQ